MDDKLITWIANCAAFILFILFVVYMGMLTIEAFRAVTG